ncbi:V-type ATP synthase subunit F [Vulcanisaeta souniana]|uniref:Vacuolar H+-transporting two-sector ATPase subunit F n=1 Tax=Vulcanisaeta souniana JCM 11219 TaxID=1293586 RepID=A0A830EJD8_9CREN|nr:V-type ATP synthase subunit F [Vulcanisaeta souniana]BDR92603.1 vacuolar H+-transporting two-sector ATPase subunit F [Vulcanisaeta souniana JCM 11219]GGI82578.1 vacuolar H+-transporting two-sector ATPase subunit F [Vulcanisaeta souniana JCM 11219]
MRAVVLGDEHTVYTFRLMGFEGKVVGENEDVLSLIKELSLEEGVGAILITSDLADRVREDFDKLRLKMRKPMLIEIPSLKEMKFREVNYLTILRSVLGI